MLFLCIIMVKIKYKHISKKRFDDAKSQGYISTIKGVKYMLMRTNKGVGLIPICVRRKK